MNILIKNKKEIQKIRIVSKLASQVLTMIKPHIIHGTTTQKINDICNQYILKDQNAIPGCLGYFGFPKSVCISINNIVCHGIPNDKIKIKNGDIVNIDVTIIKDKYYADTSKMFLVGQANPLSKKLCDTAKHSLYKTFQTIYPGQPLHIIGNTIQNYINQTPFSIVQEYCGHGIGIQFHEAPYILHHKNYNNTKLKSGMIFTIEPIINAGKKEVFCKSDKWTICTKDHSLSAQYEHTVLVTHNGCEILTKRKNEKINKIYINI